jgi:chromosome segregation ATPase
MNPEVPMSDENDTNRLTEDDGSLVGDALLRAVRRDMLGLFKALNHKVEALDAKIEALGQRVEALDAKVEALDQRVEALDQKVEALDQKVEALDQKVEALDQRVEALDQRVEALDQRVEALDQKVEARLRDTTPMWEVVVSRLDTIVAEQESQGRRLDAIEVKLGRFDAIEGELRQLRSRIERMIGELSRDVVGLRADQHDIEDRLEKLEKPPA